MENEKRRAEDSRLQKYFKFALYASGAFLVISVVFRGVITSSVTGGIQAAIQRGKLPQGYDSLKDFISSTAANDALIGALLATAACLLVYFFLKRKLSPLIVAVGILALTVVDQWRIDSRPMQIETKDDYASNFQTHDYLQFIQQDKSLYRVTDLTEQQPSNALVSYGIQTSGGYHAAKMREFQDVVDETGNEQGNGIFNPFMFNLLNTKYIIANGSLSRRPLAFRSCIPIEGTAACIRQRQARHSRYCLGKPAGAAARVLRIPMGSKTEARYSSRYARWNL